MRTPREKLADLENAEREEYEHDLQLQERAKALERQSMKTVRVPWKC
jgi:hypothetical protein